MPHTVLISISCKDRTGLVADIAGELFDLGGNLGDTAFSVLGASADLSTICELPDGTTSADVEKSLVEINGLKAENISVTPFDLNPLSGPEGSITHAISVKGGDRPGLIARLCEVFVQFKTNIVRLNSRKIPGPKAPLYEITFSISAPDESANSCLATIANTAGELGLSCSWEKI